MQEKAKRSAVEEPELIQESVHSKARGVRRGTFAGGALLTAIGLAALAVLPSNIEGAAQVADPMPAVSPTPERANAVTRSSIRTQVDVSETPTPSADPSVTPTVQPSTQCCAFCGAQRLAVPDAHQRQGFAYPHPYSDPGPRPQAGEGHRRNDDHQLRQRAPWPRSKL